MYGFRGRIIHSFYMYLLGGVLGQVAGKQSEMYAQEEYWWAPLRHWREWGGKKKLKYEAVTIEGWIHELCSWDGPPEWFWVSGKEAGRLLYCIDAALSGAVMRSQQPVRLEAGRRGAPILERSPGWSIWQCPVAPTKILTSIYALEVPCLARADMLCSFKELMSNQRQYFLKNDTNKNLWLLDANICIRLVQK